jgi:hypothetical protein
MKKFTKKDHVRKANKAKLVSQALATVEAGREDNVINMAETFTRKIYTNNREMYSTIMGKKVG